MSAKLEKGAKVVKRPPNKEPKPSRVDDMDHSSQSVGSSTFLEGLQGGDGNACLHSTALEEETKNLEEEPTGKGRAGREKNQGRQLKAPVKRKQRGAAREENKQKKKKTSSGEEIEPSPGKNGNEEDGEENVEKKKSVQTSEKSQNTPPAALVGKKPARRRTSGGQTSTERPAENQPLRDKKKKKRKKDESESGRSLNTESEKPSPRKGRTPRSRKSSSDDQTDPAENASSEEKGEAVEQRKRPEARGGTQFDVVLDAFLTFCDKYSESVESKDVQQTINTFTNNVEDQLVEKISSSKKLQVLKRENAKVGSLIRTKTKKLFEAKQELMRAERQVSLLQKEETQLALRLVDLRRSRDFLLNIRELNRRYLEHRDKHPHQTETYGASSLPALLLETRQMKIEEPAVEK